MWVRTPLALLLCAVSFSLCSESLLYHFVDQNLTWIEAQQFCRRHYHDLACVSSSEDNLRLPRPPGYSAPVWIGLYDDPTDLSQWKWTATNSSGSYTKWESGHPMYIHEPQQCGTFFSFHHTWLTLPCSSKLTALCYSGSSSKVYHASPDALSWSEALTYCRKHHTDLALIESDEENTAARAAAAVGFFANLAWIGLFRYTGRWSDNRTVAFTAWDQTLSGPKTYHQPFCVAQNVHNTWEVSSCKHRRPFYCQVPKTLRFVKLKFSGHGLDDPVMNQQILDEIQRRFEAAGHPDVKIKWKTAPEKQEKKKKNEALYCPRNP